MNWLPRRIVVGVTAKLLAWLVVILALATAALSYRATSQLERDLTDAFTSKGEAIALATATAAERSAKGDPLLIQNAIEANRHLRGVAYIYARNASGEMSTSTFVGAAPEGLVGRNEVQLGEDLGEAGVQTATLSIHTADGSPLEVVDVAAPVARGTLGVVHVGMDRGEIDRQVATLRASMWTAGAIVGASGVGLIILVVLFTITRPVRELTRVTSQIVERGDLTQTITSRSGDEIGQLAETFRHMVAKLRDVPRGIREQTELVAATAATLEGAASAQGNTVTRQAAALQETQVTAQEIKQTSTLALQKAEGVLQHAERAETLSRTGEDAVEQTLEALTAIRKQVQEIADKIIRLAESTARIGNVTQTVKDLADQTNMLALNAAIEAVRSGEHGKGFAVVAREMRSLADQSVQGTKQVSGMLGEVSSAIREAVGITERGAQRIDSSLAQVQSSGATLSELSRIVKDSSAAARQISAAVGQQNAGIAQIFTAVSDQSKMMDDTVHRLSETDRSIAALRAASDRLVDIVKQFKV